MPPTERVHRTIGGIPLRYVRVTPHIVPFYARSTHEFEHKLDSLSRNLAAAAPGWYGGLRWIATAGGYVSTPTYHGLGRAFDLVLDAWYNPAHRDHLHLDHGGGALVFNAATAPTPSSSSAPPT